MVKQTETYIAAIISVLATGVVERGKVMAKVVKRWQISDRTFDRAWKIAQKQHSEAQQRINKIKEAEYARLELEAVKTNFLSKARKREILEAIAEGTHSAKEIIIVNGQPKNVDVKPNHSAIMRAIETDNKMAGDNEPDQSSIILGTAPIINFIKSSDGNKLK